MRRVVWLLAFCLAAAAAQADTYPTKPIRAIVPFPAGSATDGMARLVSAHFTKVFGHGLVIENMVGATGTIASRATAKAPPDGYTIMFSTNSTHSANAYLYNNLGYDPIGDFTPLALLSRAPHAMVVRADASYPAFRDFVAFAKANPGKLNFGYGNTGSLAGGAMLNSYAGIKTAQVSYRGTPQVTTDLLGGQINVGLDFMSTYIPLVNDGKLRALAVTSSERAPSLPGVMTVQEAGFKGFEATAWYAIVAPAGTPADAIQKVNAVTNGYLNSPKGKAQLEVFAMQASGGTPDDLKAYIKTELEKWAPIIRAAKIEM